MCSVFAYALLVSSSVLSRCYLDDLMFLVFLCVGLITFFLFLSIYSCDIAASILTLPACSRFVDTFSFVVVDSVPNSVSTVGLPGVCYRLFWGFGFGEDPVPVCDYAFGADLVDIDAVVEGWGFGFEGVSSFLSGSPAPTICWVAFPCTSFCGNVVIPV